MKNRLFKRNTALGCILFWIQVSAQTPSVGSMTVSVEVNPMGAATASIPVFCPPGRLGMQPQVSINYNSNSGDGLLGRNITLGGMSAITRTGNNYHLNGYQEGIMLDNTKDKFELDGNRLIWVGGASAGNTGSIYRTEVDMFAKVTFSGDDFMVELKDGGRLFYGHANSKLTPVGATLPTAYYLHRRYDIDGNYIEYVYNMPGGQIQLSEIKYTGFDCTLMGTRSCSAYPSSAPYNSIQFTYKNAVAANTIWVQDKSLAVNKILDKIEVFEETNKVRVYELVYTNNGLHDYLNSIKELNGVGEHFPIVQFDWTNDNNSKKVSSRFPLSMVNSDYAQTYSGDFNGDGKSDVLLIEGVLLPREGLRYSSDFGYKIYTTDGVTKNFSSEPLNHGKLLNNRSGIENIANVLIGDVNQDGLDDIILQTINYNWNSSSHMILSVQYHAMIATIDATKKLQFTIKMDYFASYENPAYTRHNVYAPTGLRFTPYLADFDGDGWVDLLEIAKDEHTEGEFDLHNLFVTYGKNKAQRYHLSGLSGYYSANIFNEILCDMNGNGKTEILLILDNGTSVFEATASNSSFGQLYQSGFPTQYHKAIQTGDFNGDGKTDLMYYTDRWYIAYSKGTSWEEHDATTEWNVDNIPWNHGRVLNYSGTILGEHFKSAVFYQIGDFNGDGKSDILARHYDPWGVDNHFEDYKVIYYSKGYGFNRVHIGSNGSTSTYFDYSYSLLGDFDGDGKTDVFSREYATASITRSYFSSTIEYFGGWNKRLSTILSDASTQHEFVYSPLSRSTHYARRNGVKVDQAVAMTPRIWVTEKYNLSVSGTSVNKAYEYYYYQLMFHRHGRGMMGFLQTAAVDRNSSDPNLSIAIVTENEQNPEFTYKLEPVLIQTFRNPIVVGHFVESGDPLSRKEITNASVPTMSEDLRAANAAIRGIHFPYVSKVTETDFVKHVQKFICYEYDKNGNMFLSRVVHKEVGDYNEYEHADGTHNQFEQMGSWLPSMVKRTLSTKVRYVGSSMLPRYENQVNLTNNIKNKVASTQKHGNNQQLLLTEDFFYDQFGNIIVEKVDYIANTTGNPITTLTNTYNSNGRFLATSKNVLNQISTFNYEPVYGNVVNTTGANGLTTEYEYDNWGRLKETIHPDGVVETITRSWTTAALPSFVSSLTPSWYIHVSNSLGQQSWEYRDAAGRKIATKQTGLGSTFYYTNVLFDAHNRLSKESNVYSNQYDKIYSETTYDGYNRLLTKKYNDVLMARYTYDNTAVTEITKIENRDVSKTTETYATGHTSKVTDPGGEITYTLGSHNLPTQISTNGASTTLQYNDALQRTRLCDPNAGCVTSQYNALGQLVQQVDAKGNTYTHQYDLLGRLIKKTGGANEEYTYSFYGVTGQGSLNKLHREELKINGVSRHIKSYLYGTLGELLQVEEELPGNVSHALHTIYQYDAAYRVDEVHYPNLHIKNVYDATNNHTAIKLLQKGGVTVDVTLWEKTSELPNGTTTQFNYGNGFVNIWQHNANQVLDRIYSVNTGQYPVVEAIDNEYIFELQSGNLTLRKDNLNVAFGFERFFYDNADRLTMIEQPLKGSLTTFPYMSNMPSYRYHINYAGNGNITGKYDAGEYEYNANKPHAVSKNDYQVETLTPRITPIHHAEEQMISYTPFNKVATVFHANAQELGKIIDVAFEYGIDQQRIKMEIKEDYSVTNTTYYIGSASMEIVNADEVTYLYAEGKPFAMHRSSDNEIYYLHVDYQSSLLAISNEAGQVLEHRSYDAWGRPRKAIDLEYDLPNPFGGSSSSFTMRGYTFHEHLEMVGLINMNGRMYDPILGRMLSPDNFVQAPNSTQSYNRYSYCWNNPLKYTDPSGNIIFTAAAVVTGQWWALPMAIGADIGMWQGGSMANGTANPFKWDYSSGKTWGYMAGGAATGAAAGYVGGSIAMSGMPAANTMAIMFGSHINSMGTATYSGNQSDYTLSFGAASYNFDQNKWGFIGKEGNTGWENLGYGLGAFTNAGDVYSLIMGGNEEALLNSRNHSKILSKNGEELYNPGMNMEDAATVKEMKWWKAPFQKRDLVTNYQRPDMPSKFDSWVSRNQTIRGINLKRLQAYRTYTEGNGSFCLGNISAIGPTNCAGWTASALLKSGVLNIPLGIPGFISAQMYIRQYSYLSIYIK